ncbi:hypothetical protein A3B93_01630 [Candidatus Nomurabacteria bacterium RIFCSPHIGHO2_02_FULL_42_24]|uniref:Uncharacterized protein n=1 Tax=Candidatus Nomurabacteria bacterium RIFCSPHIGHO2_02_FULL_42_24 TaxID=1801757 RepID=A0A1F6WIM2_9BACT|nr:MAG: hypothetical protein UV08_C0032G0020 [Parcubacteria group bacterium GW2011_GWA2_42_18]OGI81636.1 MAG: hypothetical protein A3B93_01630 [Candidatus Nomurabacteria bacterium RIFCSPHIGHO2_02_FULL_42_24]
MKNLNDTWKDRHDLTASAYGLNVIHMLTVQTVAYIEYKKLDTEKQEEVEKLIKKYQWKTSKNGVASVIEAICQLLNPKQEIALLNSVLNNFCFRNSFYGDFGLNHIFAVIFLPILINSVTSQKKYYVSIAGRFDKGFGEKNSLFQILKLHHEVLKWHETKGQTEVNPIFRFGEDFVRNSTLETGHSNSAIEYTLGRYTDVKLNYGRAKS